MRFHDLFEAALVTYQGVKFGIPLQDSYDQINALNVVMPMWTDHLLNWLHKRNAKV